MELVAERVRKIMRELQGNHYAIPRSSLRRDTLEFLSLFSRQGFLTTEVVPRILVTAQAGPYTENEMLLEKSKKENFWHEDRFWGKVMYQDFRPCGGNVVLSDEHTRYVLKNRINELLSGHPSSYVPLLAAGMGMKPDDLLRERKEFLQEAYSTGTAAKELAKHCTIDEARQFYDALFGSALVTYAALGAGYDMKAFAAHVAQGQNPADATRIFNAVYEPPDTFRCLDAAYGRDAALSHLKSTMEPKEAGMVLEAVFGKEEAFSMMSDLYKERMQREQYQAPAADQAGGIASSVESRVAAYK